MEAQIDRILAVNIFRYVAATITVVGNSFLVYLFWKYPALRTTQCNLLILLLNVAELFIGIGVFIRATYSIYANANNMTVFTRSTCLHVNHLQGVGIVSSQVVLVAIAFDRFLAVFRPISYSKKGSKKFFYVVAAIAVLCPAFTMAVKEIGIDDSKSIIVCSTGAAASPNFVPVNFVFSAVFIVLLFSFYILALIFVFIRLNSPKNPSFSEKQEFKIQLRIFATVSIILLSCAVTFGIPTVVQLFGIFYDVGSTVKAYVTLYIGFGTVINSATNVFLYIFKHNEIRQHFHHWIHEKFPFMKKPENSTSKVFSVIPKQELIHKDMYLSEPMNMPNSAGACRWMHMQTLLHWPPFKRHPVSVQ